VHSRWPNNHPLAGEVRQVGKPLPTAHRAILLLLSGARCSITLCSSCVPTPDRLAELWKVCCIANAEETDSDRRDLLGLSDLDEVQQKSLVESVQKMVVDLPIAVLSNHRWEEDDEFTARTR
jgi:hypothetical protein